MDNNLVKSMKNSILIAKKMPVDDPMRNTILNIDDPLTFFKTDSNYVIGNVTKKPKIDKHNRIIPHRIVGPINLFEISQEIKKTISKTTSKMSSYTIGKNKEEKTKTNEIVNRVEINRLYDKIDSRIKKTDV